MSIIRRKNPLAAADGIPFRNYGAYAMLRALSPEIDGELRKAFPDVFREIMALALMRLVEGTSKAAAMKEIFDNCCLSLESPRLHARVCGQGLDAAVRRHLAFHPRGRLAGAEGLQPRPLAQHPGPPALHVREGLPPAGLLHHAARIAR